jgi:protoporphyrinogen oxidase
VLILGAGPTGILTAWVLRDRGITDISIIEKTGGTGGLARSLDFARCRLDLGAHILQTRDERIRHIIEQALGKELRTLTARRAGIWLYGSPVDYPLNFGRLMRALPARELARSTASSVRSRLFSPRSDPAQTYEGWMVARYGKRFYETTLAPMARKMWAVEPAALSEDLAIEDVMFGSPRRHEPAQQSSYFPQNCLGEIWENAVGQLREAGIGVLLNATPLSLRIERNRIVSVAVRTGSAEVEFVPDFVVSTIPLHDLVSALGSELTRETHIALERILYRALVIVYVVLLKPRMSPFHFIYFPQPGYVFQRLFEQKHFAEPSDNTGVTVVGAEISCFEDDILWRASDEELFKQVAAGLERSRLATASEIGEFCSAREPHAYPMYTWNYRGALERVLDELCGIENLLPNGRQGLFKLGGVDRCVEMGLAAADHIATEQPRKSWRGTIRRFAEGRVTN